MNNLMDQQTTTRFAIIGATVLGMLIPLVLVGGVIEERQDFFNAAFDHIAAAWGQEQNFSGPFLIVPEIHRIQEDDEGEIVWTKIRRERVYLPESLDLSIKIDHQFRRRAIYEVPVYIADVRFSGSFSPLDQTPISSDVEVLQNEARLVVGISDTKAISRASPLNIAGKTTAFAPGTGQSWIGSGISVPVGGLSPDTGVEFDFSVQVKGTQEIGFTPVGATSRLEATSSWPHPSFGGRYLPDSYSASDHGFSAEWLVHVLARELPASWHVGELDIDLSDQLARISLFQPVTDYRLIERAVKYGLLFITLTFLSFVCFELTNNLQFHPVQYGVVGLGLVLFYLALLSLSEHVDFGFAYFVSTALVSLLISWYVWAMTQRRTLTAWIASIVTSLYATLYVLLQLTDFALLVGTTVLFVGLTALMYATRSLSSPGAQV